MTDPKRDPRRRCMPLAEWPDRDRAAWAAAVRSGHLLDGQGPAAHWRPDTQKKVTAAYGRYLTFLELQGWLDRNLGPEARMTPDWLRAYIGELQQTVASVTLSGRITDLHEAFRVMTPGGKYPYLYRAMRRLVIRARPSRNKKSRVVPVRSLVRLGLSLIEQAENGSGKRPVSRACLYRDGVIILLLAGRPVRRRNLVAMHLGLNLNKVNDTYALAFDGAEVKNHRDYDRTLDPALTPFIDRYLAYYRPILIGNANGDAVWISSVGRPMTGDSIYSKVREHTETAFGRGIALHHFRDCAITSLANKRPEYVWLGMSVLHHSDPRTFQKSYNQALDSDAVVIYQRYIRQRRRGIKPKGRAGTVSSKRRSDRQRKNQEETE